MQPVVDTFSYYHIFIADCFIRSPYPYPRHCYEAITVIDIFRETAWGN